MSSSTNTTIVWFRNDLRLDDHPALIAAAERGGPVIPVFIWAPDEEGAWPPGAASRWWLHYSLEALQERLARLGSRLTICSGPSLKSLRQLLRDTGGSAVFWNQRYEPAALARDREVKRALSSDGYKVRAFEGSLLVVPKDLLTQQGTPFKVFTRFWQAAVSRIEPARPAPAPARLPSPPKWPESIPLETLNLQPSKDWASGLRVAWHPGEAGAVRALDTFVCRAAAGYTEWRDRPGVSGTSRLSPHLHFGEVSPRQVFYAVHDALAAGKQPGMVRGSEAFLRQLYWREFAHYLLYHFPHTTDAPLNETFHAFPWQPDMTALRLWRKGRTGYPIVDAGMRELWATGWMHNRVRMIVASFLVKDLLIPWQTGARWFWDTLVDADLANNTLGWQWTAGCGADAAPYFRIFNPVLQARKFDPDGGYVRRWVGELGGLPPQYVHEPWAAPAAALQAACLNLGATYPRPIVEHDVARSRALEAYAILKQQRLR